MIHNEYYPFKSVANVKRIKLEVVKMETAGDMYMVFVSLVEVHLVYYNLQVAKNKLPNLS